ncbi:lipid-A-disaccharide synthase [bacterium (Candidatus Blackallbacteria) CG17_big_fil_post_rev_8_21_14_2_50_48_46]|uniref:Lipid-A-disaccharide synthase n=1 Tax=bacterium (Candidatus Blackallbacteria) CG17_big_fil_post_rev_8_21_14_2_50_48_46 TaxID=2014261 RepID=A0A2M7G452_9BACT|nr:MAG: lipid-A-disaccharide synthase [bacterium (Candidatus Blackallbacteria) CG18_big_fil_WC_8_21_14_2_50_49_26]PIW16607.1 MAG: lipid-A-disaccharide synthase [bacterium (Candidatus Blackallbacteria) CG17_big_fil_post_rev_8_21_14_2_50_48_46]PIW46115.1 MAG: lipid-A-disaccharide synthase [bacterium (Candidatus Blackallbacteria) CG13_big_fil_rev_8_21_14_2_50_49_14]
MRFNVLYMVLFPKQESDPTSARIFLSAGEVSGDLYAALLIQALKTQAPHLRFSGVGGQRMQAAGMEILANPLSRSAIGLSENLNSLPWFYALFQRLKRWLQQVRPQAVVLIDFQGLNLRLAEAAKSLGIPVIYYIAPQDWLWGMPQNAQRLSRLSDLILAIFQPEFSYYQAQGAQVKHVGHPLLEILPPQSKDEAQTSLKLAPHRPCLCLMPGSRQREWDRLLPVLIRTAENLHQTTGAQCVLPIADPFLKGPKLPEFIQPLMSEQRYNAMIASDLILGASGNMVLEAALLGTPVIALYKVSGLTYAVASRLLKVEYITLPNILLQQALIPEFIQNFSETELLNCAEKCLKSPPDTQQTQAKLLELLQPRGASARAAQAILQEIKRN